MTSDRTNEYRGEEWNRGLTSLAVSLLGFLQA